MKNGSSEESIGEPFSDISADTVMEIMAYIDGELPKVARANQFERESLMALSVSYRNSVPASWPFAEVRWDIQSESQRFSLDGVNDSQFSVAYPKGLLLGWASLSEIDGRLHASSRRSEDELWTVGSGTKLACVIAHLANGGAVSPPLVHVVEVEGERDSIYLRGGNHRLAVARALHAEEIPIYVADQEQGRKLEVLLSVRWA